MIFSYDDYLKYGMIFPKYFHSLYSIERHSYNRMNKEYDKSGNRISDALDKLKERIPCSYFSKVYGAQIDAIKYAEYVFPTYKFILPDALWDDWLATIDPHKQYCRDHSLHQPLTAYIVSKLLKGNRQEAPFTLPNGETLLHYCAKQILEGEEASYLHSYLKSLYPRWDGIPDNVKKIMVEDIFYEAAIIAALFHDIGYPWQYVSRLSKSLKSAGPGQSNIMKRDISSIMEILDNRLLGMPFYAYSKTSKARPISGWYNRIKELAEESFVSTHGFPGALCFTQLNDAIRKYPMDLCLNDAVYRFILDWAAVAIMMHDMPKKYKGEAPLDENGKKLKSWLPANPYLRLSFEKDPLSSLIAMSDILEEFHRPGSNFCTHCADQVCTEYDYKGIAAELNLTNSNLEIVYHYKSPQIKASMKKFRHEEVEDYFDMQKGYIDISGLGIDEVICSCKG